MLRPCFELELEPIVLRYGCHCSESTASKALDYRYVISVEHCLKGILTQLAIIGMPRHIDELRGELQIMYGDPVDPRKSL